MMWAREYTCTSMCRREFTRCLLKLCMQLKKMFYLTWNDIISTIKMFHDFLECTYTLHFGIDEQASFFLHYYWRFYRSTESEFVSIFDLLCKPSSCMTVHQIFIASAFKCHWLHFISTITLTLASLSISLWAKLFQVYLIVFTTIDAWEEEGKSQQT